jgi:hypothetical protein
MDLNFADTRLVDLTIREGRGMFFFFDAPASEKNMIKFIGLMRTPLRYVM